MLYDFFVNMFNFVKICFNLFFTLASLALIISTILLAMFDIAKSSEKIEDIVIQSKNTIFLVIFPVLRIIFITILTIFVLFLIFEPYIQLIKLIWTDGILEIF